MLNENQVAEILYINCTLSIGTKPNSFVEFNVICYCKLKKYNLQKKINLISLFYNKIISILNQDNNGTFGVTYSYSTNDIRGSNMFPSKKYSKALVSIF